LLAVGLHTCTAVARSLCVSWAFLYMQVVLVYLEWFQRNSLFKCVLQPKIAKNSLKPLFWGFKVIQGHRCWHCWKARRQCLLW